MRGLGLSLLAGLLAVGAGACGDESDTHKLLEQFYDARDGRVVAFCNCFHDLWGYGSSATCEEEQKLDPSQIGCLDGIFERGPGDPPREFSSGPALQCLTKLEDDYAACISGLACGDKDGLDACIEARNEADLACPRLSEDDTEEFQKCLQF